MKSSPNEISKTFCGLPWTQVAVSPVGVVKPCCVYQGSVPTENGSALTIATGSLDEIWNGPGFREIRKKMLAGETLIGCEKCTEEERVHTISDRLFYTEVTPELLKSVEYSRKNDGKVEKLPYDLNLKVGNICNLRCRMCQPIDSCGIDTEFLKISKAHPEFRNFDNASAFDYYVADEPIELMAAWISDPRAQARLRDLLKNTSHLAYAGGEVTVTKEAMELLQFCVDTGLSKNITLDISTNLTKVSDEFIDLLSQFKLSRVACSIDGIGKVIEYVRYPSQWDTVLKGFLKILMGPENVIPILAPTVQIYNVLSVIEILDFFEKYKNKKWDNLVFCHLTLLFSPNFLSIRYLPESIRKVALERVRDFYGRSHYVKRDNTFKMKLELLMETLNDQVPSDGPEKMSQFVQYTADLDESRKQKLGDFIPELAELLKKADIKPAYPPGPEGKSFSFHRYKTAGYLFHKQGKLSEAEKMFERALELFPMDADSLFGSGLVLKSKGQLEQAEATFKKLYAVQPKHYYNLMELGFLDKARNQVDSAMNYFRLAIENEPQEHRGNCKKLLSECESKR